MSDMSEQNREHLGSRLGFILLSAGCAIGIGNVWKFPYLAGQNGGGAFVLIYIFFLIVMGVPVMTMEFAMGRAAQKSPILLYQQLEKPGHKWHIHGLVSFIGNIMLMMYYSVVAGWMLMFFVGMATGRFSGLDQAGVSNVFADNLASPELQLGYMAIIIFVAIGVCAIGLQNGLERVTKWMMLALLVIMVILAINSVFTEGASEGLRFFLLPDWSKLTELGALNVIAAAMQQAFFTLSVGIGAMAIFGSYIGKERALLGEAVQVSLLDTFVAITAGLIILPACFAFGVQPDSGPSLIFITLPNIFNRMPLGRLWGSLFFIFMTFASLSTVLAVFENIIAMIMDLSGLGRKQAAILTCVIMLILSIPCALGFNAWSGIQPLGEGSTILDFEDAIVSDLLLPIGALVYIIFCTWKLGWGWDNFVAEANTGKGLKIQSWMKGYMKYVLPIMVAIIIVMGLL